MHTTHTRKAAPASAAHWPQALLLGCALMAQGAAHADWVVPAGAVMDAPGASITLGCTDLVIGGTFNMGAGSAFTEVRNVHILPGGSLQMAAGTSLQLGGAWRNEGSVSATGAQVLRVDSPGCPAQTGSDPSVGGPLGPVNPQSPNGLFAATPVPGLGDGALAGLAGVLGWVAWRNRRRSQAPGRNAASSPSRR
jgi:hypothetical protein